MFLRYVPCLYASGDSAHSSTNPLEPPWPNSLWQPRALSFCIRFNFTVASKKSGHLNMLSMNIHGLHMCALYISLDTYFFSLHYVSEYLYGYIYIYQINIYYILYYNGLYSTYLSIYIQQQSSNSQSSSL